jgi:hypothetical protein
MKTLDIRFGSLLSITIICIFFVVMAGNQVTPQVTYFNMEEKQVHPLTKQLSFVFNREMEKQTVEQSFIIDPHVAGKFSWIGKKMVYTFSEPLDYGRKYDIYIEYGIDVYGTKSKNGLLTSRFYTAPRTLYYIGVEEGEKDRIISYDITNMEKKILTDDHLKVTDFKIDPLTNNVYFISSDRRKVDADDYFEELEGKSLYALNVNTGKQKRIFNGNGYYLNDLAISSDGRILALDRAKVNNYNGVEDQGIELYFPSTKEWKVFWNKELKGGNMFFSPRNQALVGNSDDGMLLVPLNEGDIEILGNYFNVHSFSPDSTKLLFTESSFEDMANNKNNLVILESDTETLKLFKNEGFIHFPQFLNNDEIIFLQAAIRESESELEGFIPRHRLYSYNLNTQERQTMPSSDTFSEEMYAVSLDKKKVVLLRSYIPEGISVNEFTGLLKNYKNTSIWMYDFEKEFIEKLNINGNFLQMN